MLVRHLLPGLREIVADGFDVLVVDQSRDETTARALEALGSRYLRSGPGLSRGRNVAVANTTAPLLAFTDDDVSLPQGWLTEIVQIFAEFPEAGVVCGRAVTPRGGLLPGANEGSFGFGTNPFGLGSGFNLAFRREALEQAGPFDEELGAGAPVPAAEDTDMLYRIMREGWAVRCADGITVVHHDTRHGFQQLRLHYGYGLGAGAQTAKHAAAGDETATRIGRELVRSQLVAFLRALLRLRIGVAVLQIPFLLGMRAGYRRHRSLGGSG